MLRLRDQKQLDFEELSKYLSNVTSERDRLSAVVHGHAGSTGLGLGAYIRDRVDAFRGADDDRHRVEKMRKMDVKIKEARSFGLAVTHWLISISFKMPSPQPTKHLMLLATKLYENRQSSNMPRKSK